MENKLIHLISQLEALRHDYFEEIKIIDLKGYSENRAIEISVRLNRICARMLSVQGEINGLIHKLMKDNRDLRNRFDYKVMPSEHVVLKILKGDK